MRRSTAGRTRQNLSLGTRSIPYLLRKLPVTRPNQVWATDITYIPMAKGFVYLIAVVDWFSRRVLSSRWKRAFRRDAALDHHGYGLLRSRMFIMSGVLARHAISKHRDHALTQGSQFTSVAFTDVLKAAGIAISMDGKGAWRDNVFVERLWRTRQIRGGLPARLRQCFRGPRWDWPISDAFTTAGGPHSSLDRRTPDQAYFNAPQPIPAAA